VLHLLQDLAIDMLPRDYWLTDIDEGGRIGGGGEAIIKKGVLRKDSRYIQIVLRIYLPGMDDIVGFSRQSSCNVSISKPAFGRVFDENR
jgi:hypothetical protein